MSKGPVTLGDFQLDAAVGRGGMGIVWRATHLRHHVPAAIKFVTHRHGNDERYLEQFRREAQAMAKLRHAGIVTIFDYGTVREEGLPASVGSPYIAMEWAPGGSLKGLVPFSEWTSVRECVLEILDALAHAHGRGVIHRDIKPENILVDARGRLKLADFGLAHRLGPATAADDDGLATSGTPRWMAPEQIRSAHRDQGPWTDLYSLGCVVFWMLTYRAPYNAPDIESILRGHLHDPIPRLKSRIAVPADFESWLRRLLAKDPNDRYRFAADAAHDLLQFPDEISVPIDAAELVNPHDVETMPEDAFETHVFGDEPVGLEEPSSYASYETSPIPARLTPLGPPPRSWALDRAPRPSNAMLGAGLGLWGLRQVPVVGRLRERDQIWGALSDVHNERSVRAVVLRGPAGCGKSRLARWVLERSHETGAAHIATCDHSPFASRSDGIGGLAAGLFGAFGLDSAQILGRVRAEFDALQIDDTNFDALALTELIESAVQMRPHQIGTEARDRWWGALSRYLEALSSDRPVVVHVDDVQWGAEALGFVEFVLERSVGETALVFILTAQDEGLAGRSVERSRLQRIEARPDVGVVTLGPLSSAEHEALVGELLHLEPAFARAVAGRTQGSPLFAIQLVDDCVQRGLFALTDGGFDARDGTVLPETLEDVWKSRIDRFCDVSAAPKETRHALELAATLGQDVVAEEFEAVATAIDLTIADDLVARLTRDGLAVASSAGWSFCHPMLRDVLESTANDADRAQRWHAACADFIGALYGDGAHAARRRAEHLIAADRGSEALAPLLVACEAHARRGEFDEVDALFDVYDEIASDPTGPTPEQAMGLIHRARNAMFGQDLDVVDALIDDAETMVDALDADDALLGDLQLTRSRALRHRGDAAGAIPFAEQALSHFEAIDAKDRLAVTHKALGEVYRRVGKLKRAMKAYTKARKLFDELGDDFQVGWAEYGMAATAKQLGNKHRHGTHTEAAIAAFEQSRSYTALGCAYNERGEGHRLSQDYVDAKRCYEDALRYLPPEHGDVGVTQVNLGFTHLHLGEWRAAREWFRRSKSTFGRHSRTGMLIYPQLGMLVCAAGERRWHETESLTEGVLRRLAGWTETDTDIAWLLTEAGDLCEVAGEFRRAAEFWEIARQHWGRLGRERERDELQERIDEIEG